MFILGEGGLASVGIVAQKWISRRLNWMKPKGTKVVKCKHCANHVSLKRTIKIMCPKQTCKTIETRLLKVENFAWYYDRKRCKYKKGTQKIQQKNTYNIESRLECTKFTYYAYSAWVGENKGYYFKILFHFWKYPHSHSKKEKLQEI